MLSKGKASDLAFNTMLSKGKASDKLSIQCYHRVKQAISFPYTECYPRVNKAMSFPNCGSYYRLKEKDETHIQVAVTRAGRLGESRRRSASSKVLHCLTLDHWSQAIVSTPPHSQHASLIPALLCSACCR